MRITNVQHLTRYEISYKEEKYVRMNEKNLDELDNVTWFQLSDDSIYPISEDESLKLEEMFLNAVE